jgi:hypothetical protein
MWEDIKEKLQERLSNLVDLVTSKKALVTIGASVLIVWGISTAPKIVAVAAVATAYVLAQGYVDGKKQENDR